MRPPRCQHETGHYFATFTGLAIFSLCVAIGTVLFWQCIDLIRVEHHLQQAARMALQEAVLPRATRQSTLAAANRALHTSSLKAIADEPLIAVSRGSEQCALIHELQPGDEVKVTLGAYAADIVPDWLAPLGLSLSGRKICVTMTTLIR